MRQPTRRCNRFVHRGWQEEKYHEGSSRGYKSDCFQDHFFVSVESFAAPFKIGQLFCGPFIYLYCCKQVVNKSAELQHQILNEGTCACDLSRVVDFRCMYWWFFHLFDYLDFFFSK